MKSLAIAVIMVFCCFLALDSIQRYSFEQAHPPLTCDTDTDCANKFGGNGDPEPENLSRSEMLCIHTSHYPPCNHPN